MNTELKTYQTPPSREAGSEIMRENSGSSKKAHSAESLQNANSLERKRDLRNVLAEGVIRATAFVSLAFIALILIFIFKETVPIFFVSNKPVEINQVEEKQETYGDDPAAAASTEQTENTERNIPVVEDISLNNFMSKIWQPVSEVPKYGLLPLIAGTFKVTIIAILLAAPIAILAALYTSTFAPKWAKELLKPCIEILAGFPSVVIGFFALIVLATLIQNLFGFTYRLNAFVGGVAMSLAVIPIIYTITEDALTTVPKSMTEASLALGVSKWQTALFVVLPAATPGVFAAILLGVGRAFGETMIVLMATGNAAMLSFHLAEPVRTMSATVGSEMAEVVFGEPHYHILFLIGTILFAFTFSLNAVAELYIRQNLLKKFRGA
jgi:phosphate transport system permease protein